MMQPIGPFHSHSKTNTTPLKENHSSSKKKGISLTRDSKQVLKNQTFSNQLKFRSLSGRLKNQDCYQRQIKLIVKSKDSEGDKRLPQEKDASMLQYSVNRKLNFETLADRVSQNRKMNINFMAIGNTQLENKTLNFVSNKLS